VTAPASDASLPAVLALLPHRYPFLLVDRVIALEPGRRAEGVKRVTGAEWFAGAGAMPGGLIVEALAQLSAAVLLGLVDGASGALGYFLGIDRVRYRGVVRPGDELRLVVELRQFRRGICRTHGEAFVAARRIVRADLTTVLRPGPAATVPPVT
jgi:3-hydroxyacyl-[acyl-carrier-protein] dehydratase